MFPIGALLGFGVVYRALLLLCVNVVSRLCCWHDYLMWGMPIYTRVFLRGAVLGVCDWGVEILPFCFSRGLNETK